MSIPQEEYSEVVVEERDSFITGSSVMAPSEYINPEYEVKESPEKKFMIDDSIKWENQGKLLTKQQYGL